MTSTKGGQSWDAADRASDPLVAMAAANPATPTPPSSQAREPPERVLRLGRGVVLDEDPPLVGSGSLTPSSIAERHLSARIDVPNVPLGAPRLHASRRQCLVPERARPPSDTSNLRLLAQSHLGQGDVQLWRTEHSDLKVVGKRDDLLDHFSLATASLLELKARCTSARKGESYEPTMSIVTLSSSPSAQRAPPRRRGAMRRANSSAGRSGSAWSQ